MQSKKTGSPHDIKRFLNQEERDWHLENLCILDKLKTKSILH